VSGEGGGGDGLGLCHVVRASTYSTWRGQWLVSAVPGNNLGMPYSLLDIAELKLIGGLSRRDPLNNHLP
jgi:hypothetical protein